ncbi:MAG: PepSY-associated TM helix domain-containing protein [Pseudomonadota bacterium]
MQTLRQSMSWMHTWTGLLFGWVLYFMFLTGTAGYYDAEMDRWMRPEHPAPVEVTDPAAFVSMGLDHAAAAAPDATEYRVFLPIARTTTPFVRVFTTSQSEDGEIVRGRYELLADGSPLPAARDTGGGQTLYRMHWTFHYIPAVIGEFIAGLAAVFMLAAIISGIITHKKIFSDFFTLRLAKGQRSWLDSHNVVSVMTLPYQIMITFSGILLVMTTFFLPIFIVHYGYNENTQNTVLEEVFGITDPVERTGENVALIDIAPLIARYEELLPDERVYIVTITNPGDSTSTVQLSGTIADGVLREPASVKFDGVTGEVLTVSRRKITNTMGVINLLEGLHEGLFAGPVLRIGFVISGLMGGGMIATGLVLWTKKRRQKLRGDDKAERNLIIIERLNVGVIAGLPIAIAALFYANRLVPVGIEGRAEWEVNVMFLTWLALIVHGLARKPQSAWLEQLSAAAAVFAFIPMLNALTTDKHLGSTLPLPGRPGDPDLAVIDLWFLVIGAGFAYVATIAARKSGKINKKGGAIEGAASEPAPAE